MAARGNYMSIVMKVKHMACLLLISIAAEVQHGGDQVYFIRAKITCNGPHTSTKPHRQNMIEITSIFQYCMYLKVLCFVILMITARKLNSLLSFPFYELSHMLNIVWTF